VVNTVFMAGAQLKTQQLESSPLFSTRLHPYNEWGGACCILSYEQHHG